MSSRKARAVPVTSKAEESVTTLDASRYSDAKLKEFDRILQGKLSTVEETIRLEQRHDDTEDPESVKVKNGGKGGGSLEVPSGQGVVGQSDLLKQQFETRKLLVAARDRITDKIYGICTHCPEPHLIDEARLRAVLTTTSCAKAKGLPSQKLRTA